MSDTTLRKDIWSTIGVNMALLVLDVAVVLILTEQALAKQKQDILEQKMTTVSALASRFQLRIEDATNALQVAGRSVEFSEASRALPSNLRQSTGNIQYAS